MILEGAMVYTACPSFTILHPRVYFQGEWQAANFKFRGKKLKSKVKEILISEPPQYSESVDDVDSLHSEALSVRVVTARQISPSQAHLDMAPISGIRYENASDEVPRPRSE
jgi:hypothetical protein